MNTGAPSRSAAIEDGIGVEEFSELRLVARRDPAADLEAALLESHGQAVFGVEALGQHVELQRADDANDRRCAVMRQEHLHDAFFRHLLQRLAQLLGLHRVGELDPAQNFRREARHAAKDDLLALGQRVADAQEPVIGNADDVAGERFFGQRAILGEEELRRRQRDRLAGAHELRRACRAGACPSRRA